LKRAAPWIILLMLTALSAGAAAGVNLVARRLLSPPDGAGVGAVAVASAPPAPVAAAAPASLDKRQYIEGILARNIFDPDAIGRDAETASVGVATLADLGVKLIGTFVAQPERYSAALIVAETEGAAPQSFGIDDMIQDATIVTIEVDKVTVRRGDESVQTLMLTEVAAPTAPPPTNRGAGGDDDGQVRSVGENHYEVQRELVDRYLTDLDAISRMGRAIPHRGSDGEIDGYRLSGIRRRSVGDKLGIKNGDIVHAVNGQSLDSMQGAMAAYQTLQHESGFNFEVTRRGQRTTLTYDVR